MNHLKCFKLKSGPKFILLKRPNLKTVSIVTLFKMGPILETKDNIGVSHFIEHLLFQGKNKKKKRFSSQIESLGGNIGGVTRHHFTEYFINIKSEYLEKSLKIIKEMLFNQKFVAKEVEKEKKVILEELSILSDSIDDQSWIHFLKEAYKEKLNNFNIIGNKTDLEKLNMDKIQNFYSKFCTPDNCIFALVGDMDIENVENQLKNLFFSQSKLKSNFSKPTLQKPLIAEDKIINIKRKGIKEASCLIGFSTPLASDKDATTMQIIVNILGGKTDSILFRKFIEKGILYNIYSFYDPQVVGPYVLISFKSDKDKLEEVYKQIIKELDKISFEGIGEKELENSKKYLKGQFAVLNESNRNMAEKLALSSLFDLSLDNVDKEIDEVTLTTVNSVLKNYFNRKRITIKLIPEDE